jgi:molybdopterin synthase catalytic subunit/molybdopterin converting factor small subunit
MGDDKKVHVKFFAIFREYIGMKEDWVEVEPGMTVEALWRRYAENSKNPRVVNIRAAYSVNQRLAKADTELHGGEEVGYLPPVSGGAPKGKGDGGRNVRRSGGNVRRSRANVRRTSQVRRTSTGRAPALKGKNMIVTSRKLNLSALIAQVEHPGAGGITTFTGVVRNHAHERAVKYLEYEAYPELAEKTLEQISSEVLARWPEVRLAMAHRTGHLEIGEASVMIVASAPHRAEAFAACRYSIERIKAVLPVWKKEFASDEDYWVEGPVAGEMTPDQAASIAREAEAAV